MCNPVFDPNEYVSLRTQLDMIARRVNLKNFGIELVDGEYQEIQLELNDENYDDQ